VEEIYQGEPADQVHLEQKPLNEREEKPIIKRKEGKNPF